MKILILRALSSTKMFAGVASCLFLAIFVVTIHGQYTFVDYQPQQIHIAFGDEPLEIVVTWSTLQSTPNSVVEYGTEGMNQRIEGSATLFVDGGEEKRAQYIHRVRLTGLKPFTRYVYHCGSDEKGWSDVLWFRTVNNSNTWSPRLAIYGDMGNKNAVALPRLQEETQDNQYDAIIHVGDFAYDMDDENGKVGDAFMRQIEPIAAYVPYMVAPGNHEQAYNFSHFRERFTMPGSHENLFYSFNLGPIHFVSIDTEAYYFLDYGMYVLKAQYEWLEKELQKANEPKERAQRPWVILYGHRPMYCSNSDQAVCEGIVPQLTRTGLPHSHKYALEKLLYKYNVDVAFWGHEHSYERLWPVYDNKVKKGRNGMSYYNPEATVHITTGTAGSDELLSPFGSNAKPWSARRATHYGYTTMTAYNSTHLYLNEIAVDERDDVIDDFWIVKNKHHSWTHTN